MINSITVHGHLAADPHEREIPSRTIAVGRLGVNQWKDKPTMWFDLSCFDRGAPSPGGLRSESTATSFTTRSSAPVFALKAQTLTI